MHSLKRIIACKITRYYKSKIQFVKYLYSSIYQVYTLFVICNKRVITHKIILFKNLSYKNIFVYLYCCAALFDSSKNQKKQASAT